MEKARGRDKRTGTYVRTSDLGKTEQLSELGISKQRASEYEKLVKPENRPIMEHYLEKAETTGGNLYGKVTFI